MCRLFGRLVIRVKDKRYIEMKRVTNETVRAREAWGEWNWLLH